MSEYGSNAVRHAEAIEKMAVVEKLLDSGLARREIVDATHFSDRVVENYLLEIRRARRLGLAPAPEVSEGARVAEERRQARKSPARRRSLDVGEEAWADLPPPSPSLKWTKLRFRPGQRWCRNCGRDIITSTDMFHTHEDRVWGNLLACCDCPSPVGPEDVFKPWEYVIVG